MADRIEPHVTTPATRRDLPEQADMMNLYDRKLLAAIFDAEAALTDAQALGIHRGVRRALSEIETGYGPLPGQLWETRNGQLWASVQTCDGTKLTPVDTSGDLYWTEAQVVRERGPLNNIDPHGDQQ